MDSRSRYTCRECQKIKRGNYFISETLCKKCAAKNRLPVENKIEKLDNGIEITQMALRRLENRANQDIPMTFRDEMASIIPYIIIAVCWIAAYYVIRMEWQGSLNIVQILLFIGLITPIPVAIALPIKSSLEKPREKKIKKLLLKLARQRKKSIEAAKRFYTSSEWKIIRKKIIENHKNICKSCGQTIDRAYDITIDHILPRSKYPKLSLEINNLQVLCRRCNSAKGNYAPVLQEGQE